MYHCVVPGASVPDTTLTEEGKLQLGARITVVRELIGHCAEESSITGFLIGWEARMGRRIYGSSLMQANSVPSRKIRLN